MTTAIKKIKKIYNKNIKETVVAAAAAMRKSEQPDFSPPPPSTSPHSFGLTFKAISSGPAKQS